MSQVSELKDRSGVTFFYGDGGDVWFPPFPLPYSYKAHLDVIKNLTIRNDDILVTGYPKSGCNWHYEILSMLVRGSATYVRSDKLYEMMDRVTSEHVDAIPSPRILNTHLRFRFLPTQILQKKTKIVYLQRNPKDVAVSLYNHVKDRILDGYSGSWPDFLHLFLYTGVWYNNWFDTARDWEKEIENHPEVPIFVSVYEETVRDPVGQVMKLNEFLGLDRSPELCRQIADACGFEKLKAAHKEVKVDTFENTWKEGSPGFFRKGKVGDWRTWFTEEQNEVFDKVYCEAMKDSKLNFIFEI